ncbi:hypothetical protein GGS20DRAFT_281290 [Poronia punctata]|nr:hypothetical protein GGS20DRAFT_281290 [Poronia punctata]
MASPLSPSPSPSSSPSPSPPSSPRSYFSSSTSPSFSFPNMEDQRKKTINALLRAYSSLSVSTLLGLLAPGFRHQTLPSSLGMPIRDREAFGRHAEAVFAVFEKFDMEPKTIVDNGKIVAIHAHMLGTFRNKRNKKVGAKGGKKRVDFSQWKNECVMLVTLTEDLQVLDIKEFVDSAKAREMAGTHAPEAFGQPFFLKVTAPRWLFGMVARNSRYSLFAVVLLLLGIHRGWRYVQGAKRRLIK